MVEKLKNPGFVGLFVEQISVQDASSIPSFVYAALARELKKMSAAPSKESKEEKKSIYVCQAPSYGPKTTDISREYYPIEKVEPLTFQKGLETGTGRTNKWHHESSGNEVPFSSNLKSTKKTEQKEDPSLKESLDVLETTYKTLTQKSTFVEILTRAEQQWKKAEVRLSSQIEELSGVFEEYVFPHNKYTRRKADLKGSTIYLPGLIKAVITDWHYKKYLSSQTGGGKRHYSIALVVDTSLSMQGHLGQCVVESLVTFIAALSRCGIEDFSILTFGKEVRLLKSEIQEWGPAAIYLLLSALKFDEYSTLDANAVRCVTDLMVRSSNRGPKKVFIFTDGYGTTGLR
jgi:hypothetical protein